MLLLHKWDELLFVIRERFVNRLPNQCRIVDEQHTTETPTAKPTVISRIADGIPKGRTEGRIERRYDTRQVVTVDTTVD